MDLGECPKIHSAALKADYEIAAKKREYGYDVDVSITALHFIIQCSYFVGCVNQIIFFCMAPVP